MLPALHGMAFQGEKGMLPFRVQLFLSRCAGVNEMETENDECISPACRCGTIKKAKLESVPVCLTLCGSERR
jgi:hypothetical protein